MLPPWALDPLPLSLLPLPCSFDPPSLLPPSCDPFVLLMLVMSLGRSGMASFLPLALAVLRVSTLTTYLRGGGGWVGVGLGLRSDWV